MQPDRRACYHVPELNVRERLIFRQGSKFMAVCSRCNQKIRETVVEGRKLIALVHRSPHDQPCTGRFLTILKLSCGCGDRMERRYENRPMCELNPAPVGSGQQAAPSSMSAP